MILAAQIILMQAYRDQSNTVLLVVAISCVSGSRARGIGSNSSHGESRTLKKKKQVVIAHDVKFSDCPAPSNLPGQFRGLPCRQLTDFCFLTTSVHKLTECAENQSQRSMQKCCRGSNCWHRHPGAQPFRLCGGLRAVRRRFGKTTKVSA